MIQHYMFQSTVDLNLTKFYNENLCGTSVTVNNNSPIQDYVHPRDQTQPTFELWY